ncbi:MAG: PH domain-containing protein [Lachnospiraceae bacterium]|nr:PH domain-containing protein [Lachnospiraceae bacterium]
MAKQNAGMEETVLWKGKKRIMFLGLPWTFTTYKITENRLFITRGFLTTKYDEVRLYRIRDVSLKRTLLQKMIGTGTISVCSTDSTMKDFEIINVKDSERCAEILSSATEHAREKARVSSRELMVEDDHEEDDDRF